MSKFKYAAFISYSTRDRWYAARLQRKLKGYRIPKRYGEIDVTGQGRKQYLRRIKPVFRDRDELSSGDLNAKLKQALDESAALVVVCSPNSAKSRWVEAEVQHFIDQGRSDRIFAIIKSGKPNASGKQEARECLPASLRGSGTDARNLHVVAGDARERVDGPKVAFLKVVAGIAGISFSDLVDRDAKRTRTTRRWVLGSVLGFAVLLVLSLSQALKASHDNAVYGAFIAEGNRQVETMFFDAYVKALDATKEARTKARKYTAGFLGAGYDGSTIVFPQVFSGNLKPDEIAWDRTDIYYRVIERVIESDGSNSTDTVWDSYTYTSEEDGEFEKYLNRSAQGGLAEEPTLSVIRNQLPAERQKVERQIDAERTRCHDADDGSFTRASRFWLDEGQFAGAGVWECHSGAFASSYTLVPKEHLPKNSLLYTLRQILVGLIAIAVAWVIFEVGSIVARALRGRSV